MRISIIIPCYNEEKCLPQLLDHLGEIRHQHDVIIVDGGSTDDTLKLLNGHPEVQVIQTQYANRAAQMNHGAREATGDVFLFLHSDTFLPGDFAHLIDHSLTSPDVVGGAFFLRFSHNHWMLKIMSWITRLNIRWITVGDHAMFFRRQVFESLGGYPEIPLLEDLEFQLKARKLGRMVRVQAPVHTSARRFLNNGVLRQTWKDASILIRYYMGTSPVELAKEYSNNATAAR